MTISALQTIDLGLSAQLSPVAAPVSATPVSQAQTAGTASVDKPYFYSPALTVDPKTGTVVLEIRDASTGDVTNQYPSEKDLKAYAEHCVKPNRAPAANVAPAQVVSTRGSDVSISQSSSKAAASAGKTSVLA